MDYLEIREDSGIGKLINTFCGTNAEPVQTPKKLWIKFKSDNEGAGKGFRAHFQVIGGDELSGPVGTITSPLYPIPYKQSYTMWRITVEFGSIIRIDITDIYINNFDTGINSLKVYIKHIYFKYLIAGGKVLLSIIQTPIRFQKYCSSQSFYQEPSFSSSIRR